MRLLEIKHQSLALMYPDAVIRYDDSQEDEINNAVYELKSNPNFEGMLEASVGAINRAFAHIEAKGISTTKCVDFPRAALERAESGKIIIVPPTDFYSVDRVLCHAGDKTYACGYEIINGAIHADYMARSVYTLVYKTKIPRIRRTTADSFPVELSAGVCEAIPYFVMAELFAGESAERAREARLVFQQALDRAQRISAPCHECFQIIYSAVE